MKTLFVLAMMILLAGCKGGAVRGWFPPITLFVAVGGKFT